MHTQRRKREKRRGLWVILFGLLIFAAALALQPEMSAVYAAEETAQETAVGKEPDDSKLVITVVEDIPAMEIEENEVPLAAFPDTAGRSGTRHAVLMGLVFACVLAYVLYMGRYEKKLVLLRKQAARGEAYMMQSARRNKAAGSKTGAR